MLDRDLIRRDPDLVRRGLSRKRGDAGLVDRFLATDARYRAARTGAGDAQAEANRLSKSIGVLMGQGKREEAEAAKGQAKALKERAAELEAAERVEDEALRLLELEFPNLPAEGVPDGATEEENVVVRTWGEKPHFEFEPKPHWELAEAKGLLDLPRGAKVAGSGFALYTGLGARLQRALFTWMIEFQTGGGEGTPEVGRGYREIYPPYLVNAASLVGTGNLPKFEEDLYRTQDDLYLIPTAEVPVTNIYRDEILEAGDLPIRMAAYSACFRREAGAAGKDTRGLLRIHQFDKVELVKIVAPETSYEELETLTADAEAVLQALGLHYRVVELCAGDLGDKPAKCYDLEVWAPGVGRYLEISSCSNFEAFQSRRAMIRYRPEAGAKPEYVHVLNGSGLATPRLFAAILETFQTAEGDIELPPVLHPYVGRAVV